MAKQPVIPLFENFMRNNRVREALQEELKKLLPEDQFTLVDDDQIWAGNNTTIICDDFGYNIIFDDNEELNTTMDSPSATAAYVVNHVKF